MSTGRPTRTAITWRVVMAFLLGAATLVITASPASAHRFDESYLYLDVTDDAVSGSIHMPYRDLQVVFGYTAEETVEALTPLVEANLADLEAYAAQTAFVGLDGQEWEMTFTDWYLLEEGSDGIYVVLNYDLDLPFAEVPPNIDVSFTAFLDEIPGRNNIALIGNDWKRGVIDEEANELVFFSSSSTTGTIELDDPSQWRNFSASINLGVDHIKRGPDHIFFIMVLLLPSVLVLAGTSWAKAPSFGASLWRVLKVATMFTVAHSITFTLAGLDLLPLPPSKLVETIIAASIAAAALHNIKPIFGQREWALAFVFGLFHGMGFAGLVEDLEIDQTTKLVSLLGRNVGIEIGQAVIILIIFPTLWVLSRTRWYKPVFVAGSLLLAAISIAWIYERILEEDLGINEWIEKVTWWPRSFWLCVGAFLIACAIWWRERDRGDDDIDAVPPSADDHDGELVGV